MLNICEKGGLVWIRAGGTLDSANYDSFVPQFERIAAEKRGAAPMVSELAPDFAGWDLGASRRDLKFDVEHKDSFGRIAIVGDSKWEECRTKLFGPVFWAEMKFFAPVERDAAESWARVGGDAA